MSKLIDILKNNKSIVMYLIFGVATTVVNIITYALCYEYIRFSNLLSTIIAWFFAVAFAFVTNKLFVFESKGWKGEKVMKEMLGFIGCRVGTGVVEAGMMLLFVDVLLYNGTLMKLITNIVVIILNFVASKFLVFNNK